MHDRINASKLSLFPVLSMADQSTSLKTHDLVPHRWTTAVHETRYESERCLEKTKQEMVVLEQKLVKLGWSRDAMLAREKKKVDRMKRCGNEENEAEKSPQDDFKKEKEDPIKVRKNLCWNTKHIFSTKLQCS